jgi:hypothetical protein
MAGDRATGRGSASLTVTYQGSRAWPFMRPSGLSRFIVNDRLQDP